MRLSYEPRQRHSRVSGKRAKYMIDRCSEAERLEQLALESDLVAQLSPSEDTQRKAKASAGRLRELLKRIQNLDTEA